MQQTIIVKPKPKEDQILKGVIYACLAFFSFTVMNGFNKLLVEHHNAIEIAFFRNILALVPCTIFIFITNQKHLFKSAMPKTLALRVCIGTVGLILTLAAAQELPLADATVIFFLSTLLIPVMAHFYLKEHIGWPRWAAVGIGMTGVVLVAQPSGDVTTYGIMLALGAAFVHATIQVLIRAMRSENPFTITYYFFLAGTVVPGLALPWVGHMPVLESVPYILGVGAAGSAGQYFLTRGFQMAPASLLGPFNYTGLVWAVLLDILIWGYIPGWPVFIGSGIIIAAGLFIVYREQRAKKNRQSARKN